MAICLANPDLRTLVRLDLEQQGFEVAAVSGTPQTFDTLTDVDVVVTEFLRPTAPLTIHVVDDTTWPTPSLVRVPVTRLDTLGAIIDRSDG